MLKNSQQSTSTTFKWTTSETVTGSEVENLEPIIEMMLEMEYTSSECPTLTKSTV